MTTMKQKQLKKENEKEDGEIVHSIEPQYLPPIENPPSHGIVTWAEDDPFTKKMLIERAMKEKENAMNAEAEAKRLEQQRQQMAKLEQLQKQRYKEQRETRKKLPELQFEMLVSGRPYTCGYCQSMLRYLTCNNPYCQAHGKIDVHPILTHAKEEITTLRNENAALKQRIEELQKEKER